MTNPKTACDAILASEKDLGGLTVYPNTIARYALLELTRSPFVDSKTELNLSNILPSFYIMCTPKEELRKWNSSNIGEMFQTALEWAEDLDTELVPKLIDAIAQELGLLKKLSPE